MYLSSELIHVQMLTSRNHYHIGTTGPPNQLNRSVLSEVVSGITPSLLLF